MYFLNMSLAESRDAEVKGTEGPHCILAAVNRQTPEAETKSGLPDQLLEVNEPVNSN